MAKKNKNEVNVDETNVDEVKVDAVSADETNTAATDAQQSDADANGADESNTDEISEGAAKADKKKKKKKAKAEKEDKELTMAQRRLRHGVLTSTAVVVVIAVVILANVLISARNWNYDFTSEKLYTLSDSSKKIVKALEKDVTIYFLDKESSTNSVYKNVFAQYEKAGSHISVEYKDLTLYPDFPSTYLSDGTTASDDDIIVVCGDNYRYISNSDLISYDYSSGETSVNIEPKVTAAINYVVEDEREVIYTMSGQGEQDLGSNFESALETDNYDVEELNIVQTGGIPTDCSLLVINAPTSDLDTSIISMIEEYMENDGKLFVVLDPNDMYTNLNGLLAEYGVQVEEGIVLETGDGYYMGNYPTYLLPTLASHDITTPITTKKLTIVAPVAKGLTAISDDSSDYTVTDLLVTSAYSFSKVDTSSSSIEQTDDDIAGPLAVAQIVENADGDGVLFVSGCSSMGVDEIDNYVSNANTNLYNNAVNYLTQQENKISIKAPVVSNNYAVFSAFATKMVLAIGIVGIPLFLLVLGLVVVLVRRNN